jgi:hypothetical protein
MQNRRASGFVQGAGNLIIVFVVTGWKLERNNHLPCPANSSASGGVANDNGTNDLNVVNPTGNLLYRLTHPEDRKSSPEFVLPKFATPR